MRIRHLPLTAAVLLVATAATASPIPPDVMTLQPQSRLWIEGTSTTKSFSCTAGTLDVNVEAAGPGAASAVARGEKAVTTVTLAVPSARLDCNNGTMNNHMYKALKIEQHPTIQFALASYELSGDDQGMLATMKGSLTLGGVTKSIEMKARTVEDQAGMLRVTGSHSLRMTEYGIKPPSLMLGTMKVGDQVKVNFDLYLKS